MKPHIDIKLKSPLPYRYVPHWLDFIGNKTVSIEKFNNDLDGILKKFNRSYWITKEYKPKTGLHYSADEIRQGFDRIYRIILKEETALPNELIDAIKFSPSVDYARPVEVSGAELPAVSLAASADFQFDRSRDQIFLRQAHLYSKGNPDIKIAVLDTGVDVEHPELEDAVVQKADFVNIDGLDTTAFIGDTTGFDNNPGDEVGHGSHVSGIIAGKGLKMPQGVAPHCKIMAIRVLATLKQGDKRVGAGLIDNINTGIKWAVDQGADIINMSLGIKHEGGGLPHAEVIRYALEKGVTIVAASGNDGGNDKYYPGALPGVIAVGAIDTQGEVAPFSTYGAHVTLVAPGSNVYSSYLDHTYAFSSGTSQAAPFVSGGIALLKSYALSLGHRLPDQQLKDILKHTSDKVDRRFRDIKGGYGSLNLIDALKLLKYSLT